MVKKPIDEDRLRRKELLEQKKAARKAAKEEEEEERLAAAARAATNSTTVTTTTNAAEDATAIETNDSHSGGPSSLRLMDLPLDAIHLVFSMLCVKDLGRLRMVYHHRNSNSNNNHQHSQFHHYLVTSRTSYLLSRLWMGKMTQLCTTEQEARTLLEEIENHSSSHQSSLLSSPPNKKKSTHEEDIQNFFCYVRFLEEMVTGYATLRRTLPQQHPSITNHSTTITLPKFVHGRFVSISPEHSVIRLGGQLTNPHGNCSGVATWGVGKRGQLGHHLRADVRHPTRLRYGIGYGPNVRIVQVAAGGGLVRVAHTLLLTSTGRVLSFGTGQYGALGHGYNAAKQLPDCLKPTFIEALSQVTCTSVAAGELHSAAVTVDGDVYTWGDGFCGQLGHGDKRPITVPKQVTTGGLDDECIANVTCGSRHTIAITEDGECYTWGLGHFGVLGRSFTPFEYDADTAVHAFATATTNGNNDPLDHAMQRLTVNANGDPQPPTVPPVRDTAAELAAHLDLIANLTLDDSSDQCIPKIVDSLQGIQLVGASAGHRHSLFLDTKGYLYSCGAGGSGCLGHGNTESCMYPCRIVAMNDDDETDIVFRQMSAGVDISMAVSNVGAVYAWGKTEGGRIGMGMAKSQITKPRRVYLNDTTKPTVTTSASSKGSTESKNVENDSVKYKAVDVECGYVHSIIVALNGTTYICGGVGIDGEDDGQRQQEPSHEMEDQDDVENGAESSNGSTPQMSTDGRPKQISDVVIWQPLPEPKDEIVKKERWQKLGKYEVKGRSKMS